MFEEIMRKIAPGAGKDTMNFDRITDSVIEFTLHSPSEGRDVIKSYVITPFGGMGIFYYHIPKTQKFSSSDNKAFAALKHFDFFKFNYCLGGRVEVFIKGKGKYAYLEEGMLAFDVNDMNTVLSFPKGGYTGFGIYFNFDLMTQEEISTLAAFGISKEACVELYERDEACFLGNASSAIRSMIESIVEGIDDRSIDVKFARVQAVGILYRLLNNDVIPLGDSQYTTQGQRRLAEEAEKIMSEDLSVHLTAEDIAARLKCTAPTLKKYFRKVYGVPMYSYLQKARLDRAAQKLRLGSGSIALISEEAGYQNQSKFCAQFKKTYGVTPSEYRRLNS